MIEHGGTEALGGRGSPINTEDENHSGDEESTLGHCTRLDVVQQISGMQAAGVATADDSF